MLRRTITSTLHRALRTFPAVVLTGARQTGKTTLLRSEFATTHRYVSLDDPDVRMRADADPVGFFAEHPPPLILDEIQHVPGLLPYVKRRIDEDRRAGQWIITGSQAFALMAGVSESLAGRASVLSLLALSVAEASGRPGDDCDLDSIIANVFMPALPTPAAAPPPLADWLLRGAWPELRANPVVDRRLWCAGYLQTYLERDLRALAHIGDLRSFERFLRLCAARTAQLLNLSELARDAGVAQATAARWLSVLEAGGQVHLLPPLHGNYAKRLVKSPKLYFVDTALCTYLVGLHEAEATLGGPMAGALFETAVVGEWLKAFHHRGETPTLSFFRTGDGVEVDLVIERNGQLYAGEVKCTATVLPKHGEGLARFRALSGSANTSVVFANIDRPLALRPGIVARPWNLDVPAA